jgi:hypothetical protein
VTSVTLRSTARDDEERGSGHSNSSGKAVPRLRFWGFAGAATVKGSDRDVPANGPHSLTPMSRSPNNRNTRERLFARNHGKPRYAAPSWLCCKLHCRSDRPSGGPPILRTHVRLQANTNDTADRCRRPDDRLRHARRVRAGARWENFSELRDPPSPPDPSSLRGAAAARRRSSLRPRLQPLRLLNLPRDPFQGAPRGLARSSVPRQLRKKRQVSPRPRSSAPLRHPARPFVVVRGSRSRPRTGDLGWGWSVLYPELQKTRAPAASAPGGGLSGIPTRERPSLRVAHVSPSERRRAARRRLQIRHEEPAATYSPRGLPPKYHRR